MHPVVRRSGPGWRRLVLTTASATTFGCALAPPAAPAPEPRPLGNGLEATGAPQPATLPPRADDPPPPFAERLTLAQALERAMARSPALAASSWRVRAREGLALQAGLIPNPRLEAEVENFAGTGSVSGFGAAETTLRLAQPLETAGKRAKRSRSAGIAAEIAAWRYETTRLEVHAEVVRRFADVLAAQERVALTQELLDAARKSADAVARRVEAGATPSVERTRARLEVSTIRVDLATARRTLAAARADLAATWGGREPGFERATGALADVAAPPAPATVRTRLARNPELRLWDREVERREALVALEDARRVPDVTVAAGLRRLEEVDDTALVAGISVPLPVFDRSQGSRAAARSELHEARHERRAVRARLAADLERARQDLAARFEEVEALRGEILPRAREILEDVRRSYARGLLRNVDVLDAQRRLFELKLREIDALRGYHGAASEIERLTGTPLSPEPPRAADTPAAREGER